MDGDAGAGAGWAWCLRPEERLLVLRLQEEAPTREPLRRTSSKPLPHIWLFPSPFLVVFPFQNPQNFHIKSSNSPALGFIPSLPSSALALCHLGIGGSGQPRASLRWIWKRAFSARTQVAQYRRLWDITVEGRNVPNLVRYFQEGNFPDYCMQAIAKSGFVEPTPIQSDWYCSNRLRENIILSATWSNVMAQLY